MRIRWRNLELPTKVVADPATRTDTYAQFTAEPFERGFGTTVGQRPPPRPALLDRGHGRHLRQDPGRRSTSSASLDGVKEDVTDIILNAQAPARPVPHRRPQGPAASRRRARAPSPAPTSRPAPTARSSTRTSSSRRSPRTAPSRSSSRSRKGRGYVTAEENAREEQEIGVIPVDCDLLARAARALPDREHARRQDDQLRPPDPRDLDRRHGHAGDGAGRGRQDLPQAPEPVRPVLRRGQGARRRGGRGRATLAPASPFPPSAPARPAAPSGDLSEGARKLELPISPLDLSVRASNSPRGRGHPDGRRPRLPHRGRDAEAQELRAHLLQARSRRSSRRWS